MFTHRDVCFLVHLELRCWRFFSSCTVGVDVLYLRYALHQRDKKKEMEHRERNVNVIHMIHAVSNVYHRCYDTRNDCHRKMLMMMMSATTVINSRLPKKSSLAKRFNANSAKAGKSKLWTNRALCVCECALFWEATIELNCEMVPRIEMETTHNNKHLQSIRISFNDEHIVHRIHICVIEQCEQRERQPSSSSNEVKVSGKVGERRVRPIYINILQTKPKNWINCRCFETINLKVLKG